MSLHNRHVAILIAPRGTEDSEFSQPRDALRQAGVQVSVIGLEGGQAQTVRNDLDPADQHTVDIGIGQADARDYDALVIPGGTVGADKLRADARVVALVRAMAAAGKPVAAICHGPWVLAEAGLAHQRSLTSYPSLQTDLINAGGQWQDREVVVDRGIITSRKPDDLPAFNQALLDALAQLPG